MNPFIPMFFFVIFPAVGAIIILLIDNRN